MKLYKTTETKSTDSYPYGYKKTTAYFSLEFKRGKGFRSVFQTINPKTGKLNKPKKGTYSHIKLLGIDENEHYKFASHAFYNGDKVNDLCKFLNENYDLFTPEQIEYIAMYFLAYLRATAKSMVIYCKANTDKTLEVMDRTVKTTIDGIKTHSNFWGLIDYPHQELEALKDPTYNPFRAVAA